MSISTGLGGSAGFRVLVVSSPGYCVSCSKFVYFWWTRCELRPGGAELDVSASDLHLWVEDVTRVLLVDSVIEQVGQLVKGKRASNSKRRGNPVPQKILGIYLNRI